jgi:hypothetical protein
MTGRLITMLDDIVDIGSVSLVFGGEERFGDGVRCGTPKGFKGKGAGSALLNVEKLGQFDFAGAQTALNEQMKTNELAMKELVQTTRTMPIALMTLQLVRRRKTASTVGRYLRWRGRGMLRNDVGRDMSRQAFVDALSDQPERLQRWYNVADQTAMTLNAIDSLTHHMMRILNDLLVSGVDGAVVANVLQAMREMPGVMQRWELKGSAPAGE